MNKKEQAALDAAISAAAINRALRWSDVTSVERDLPAPEGIGSFTQGWDFNSYYIDPRTYPAWSESTCHGDGNHPGNGRNRSASQNARNLYSTKVLALRALRCELEAKYAAKLASIDAQIAEEPS